MEARMLKLKKIIQIPDKPPMDIFVFYKFF